MTTTRDHIVDVACDLLEAQGYHATGMNQIIQESGAPKGSLYYYFPEGKEELAAEAVEKAGKITADRIRMGLTNDLDAPEAVRNFIHRVAEQVEASGFRAGGPLTTVAMETATSSERLNLACRESYDRLQGAFEERLVGSGYPPERAGQLAVFITTSIEGGIILSRTYHTGDPLRRAGDEVALLLKSAKA
jgi:TetR/AcrR family transcriptional repressor of lmrAB and yxaGH operons